MPSYLKNNALIIMWRTIIIWSHMNSSIDILYKQMEEMHKNYT